MAEFGGIPITENAVVGPDDFVVINLGSRVTLEHLDRARQILEEKWPDIGRRLLIVSAEELAIIRKGESKDGSLISGS